MKDKRTEQIRKFLDKIVVNVGVGRLSQQPNFEAKILEQLNRDVSLLAGQKPQVTRARKSIAGFKIREGQIVGLRATLRNQKMVDFLERFITIVLPRVHDFRGLAEKNVDASGTLNVGLREQLVFPEVNAEESPVIFPLGVNLVPKKKKNRDAAMSEYRALGVPFEKIKIKK